MLKRALADKPVLEAANAALQIQCRVRRMQASRYVAQRRYWYWRDTHARRRVLLATLKSIGALHIGSVNIVSRVLGPSGGGLRVEHFANDLPAWETRDLEPYMAPPAYAAAKRRQRHNRNVDNELKWRQALRRLRVRTLRLGARPNRVVCTGLLGDTATKKYAENDLALVHEDRDQDASDWARFSKAAPVARSYQYRRTSLVAAAHFITVGASRTLGGLLGAMLATYGWLHFAYALQGADAMLKYALARRDHSDYVDEEQARQEEQHIADQLPIRDMKRVTAKAHFAVPLDSVESLRDARRSAAAHIDISRQFGQSPHLRVSHVALYHGAWSKKRLYPQGEGLIEFLDGFACGEEEKTLAIKLLRATDLRAMDLTTSDPFVVLKINNRKFRSRTKQRTLHPEYYELFEVDVSDSRARLEVEVWDWDRFSRNDYMGGCSIQLGALPQDQLKRGYRAWYNLGNLQFQWTDIWRGPAARLDRQQVHDRGQIELELTWLEKPDAEDLDTRRLRRRGALKLESWTRGRLATLERRRRQSCAALAKQHVDRAATTVQTGYRATLSRRILRYLNVQRRATLRLQAFFRRRFAFKELQSLRARYHAATKCQLVVRRHFVAPIAAARVRLVYWVEKISATLVLQGFARCSAARRLSRSMQHRLHTSRPERFPLSWLLWYGRDHRYGSKRSRRLFAGAAYKMLQTPGTRIRTIYGSALVARCPAPPQETRAGKFVLVELLGCLEPLDAKPPLGKAERAQVVDTAPRHIGIVRYGAFLAKESVLDRVVVIQSHIRFYFACSQVLRLIERQNAARCIQRCMQHRLRCVNDAAAKIQVRARVMLDMRRLACFRREVDAAVQMQQSYRQRKAKLAAEGMRRVNCVAALASSEYDVLFSASHTLDDRPETFWCSKVGGIAQQWIVYDMLSPTCIGVVELTTPDSTTAPRSVSIDVGDAATGPFRRLISVELPAPKSCASLASLLQLGNPHVEPKDVSLEMCFECGITWHRLKVPPSNFEIKRYWRLSMLNNWSSSEGIRLTGVRWLRAKEFSPWILEHPHSFVMEPGPQIGRLTPTIELLCMAIAWPKPTFQWHKDSVPISGATTSKLVVQARVTRAVKTKKFRCPRCRQVNLNVPTNIYRNLCLNCLTVSNCPEQEASAIARHDVASRLHALETQIAQLARRIRHTQTDADVLAIQLRLGSSAVMPKEGAAAGSETKLRVPFLDHLSEEAAPAARRQRLLAKLTPEVRLRELRTAKCELETLRSKLLEEKMLLLFEALRVKQSGDDLAKLDYECEGVYECHVTNVRGRDIVRKAVSRPAAVYIGDPPPFKTKVVKDYRAKTKTRRKHFDRYMSMHGFFERGQLVGDVVVKYASGDSYCGPLVAERWLDHMGISNPEGRSAEHWGLWYRLDGTIYEGSSIDNHFDAANINGDLRITYSASASALEGRRERYDGEVFDSLRHGVGEFWYADGSKYRGEWQQGMRHGHGRLESSDKLSYFEGDWDCDRIHGNGIWHWQDGSSYAGEVHDGVRSGKGVYVSDRHDVYVGEFLNNQMHGAGVLTYHDGSRFEGRFQNNQRSGMGVFTNVSGVKFYGPYVDGLRHGEFLIRRPVVEPQIPGNGSTTIPAMADEIQQGVWAFGEFMEWTTPPINPVATTQFCEMFERNEEEFDGVYALMIARRLPLLPHGVQPDHPRVVPIVERIRAEGGILVATDTYDAAKTELLMLEPAFEATAAKMRFSRDEMARHSELVRDRNRVVEQAEMQMHTLIKRRRKLESRLEKFWAEEDRERARQTFLEAAAEIEAIELREFFVVRYFPEPPPLLEKIMRATCALLGEPESWKAAQLLLSSSQHNADAGDQEALVAKYDVKLKHKLKHFDVWARAQDVEAQSRVDGMLADSRFQPDHHHVASYGVVPPALVKLARAAHTYIRRTAAIKPVKTELDAIINNAKHAEQRKADAERELSEATQRFDAKRAELEQVEREGGRAERAVERVRRIVLECEQLIEEYSDKVHNSSAPDDYYLALDVAKSREPRHDVAVVLDVLSKTVQNFGNQPPPRSGAWLRVRGHFSAIMGRRIGGNTVTSSQLAKDRAQLASEAWLAENEREAAHVAIDAALRGMPPDREAFNVRDFTRHATLRARHDTLRKLPHYFAGGRLYFGSPPASKTVVVFNATDATDLQAGYGPALCERAVLETAELVCEALRRSALRMVTGGHANAPHSVAAHTRMRVDLSFVEVLVRHEWYQAAQQAAVEAACQAWEAAFPPLAVPIAEMTNEHFFLSPEYNAISARTNWIMSADAVSEAAIWERRHRASIVFAESRLAAWFEAEYEPTDIGAARAATRIRDDRDYGCDAVAAASVWCKLNPGRVMEARLDDEYGMVLDFETKYADRAALVAARVLAGVSPEGFEDEDNDGSSDLKAATAWAEANVAKIVEVQGQVGDDLANKFVATFTDDEGDIDDVTHRIALKAVRAELDPNTPSRFRAAGRTWKARNRRAFARAYNETRAQIELEDNEKAKEVATCARHLDENINVALSRMSARRAHIDKLDPSDQLFEHLCSENDADVKNSIAAFHDHINNMSQLLDLRVNMHDMKRRRIKEDLDLCVSDKSYLVTTKRCRPSDVENILLEQKRRHFKKIDAFEAAHVVQVALLQHLSAHVDRIKSMSHPFQPSVVSPPNEHNSLPVEGCTAISCDPDNGPS